MRPDVIVKSDHHRYPLTTTCVCRRSGEKVLLTLITYPIHAITYLHLYYTGRDFLPQPDTECSPVQET